MNLQKTYNVRPGKKNLTTIKASVITADKSFKVNSRVLKSTQAGVSGTTDTRGIIVVSMADCNPPFSLHPYHVSEDLGFVLSDPLVSGIIKWISAPGYGSSLIANKKRTEVVNICFKKIICVLKLSKVTSYKT